MPAPKGNKFAVGANSGRPSKYRSSVCKGICIRLMIGQSLTEICKLPQYPSKVTVISWLHKHEEFLNQYRRAREIQYEIADDEIKDIADNATNDYMETHGDDAMGYKVIGENIQRSKLRVDTRKWIMERRAAKVFGNKQVIDHKSTDGSMSPNKGLDDFYNE